MKSMERVQNLLKELGLTEYEARVYTALVASGPAGAGGLSEASNVPYSRIYDVLSKLERRGWVEVQAGRPAIYRAKPPAEVMRLSIAEQERRLEEVGNQIVRELEPIYEKKEEVKKPEVWIVRGWKNILARATEMITKAKVEVLISIPQFASSGAEFLQALSALKTKDLRVRILTTKRSKISSFGKSEMRWRENLFGGGLVVDGREILLVLGGKGEAIGIWSDEIGLARFGKDYFEYLWKDSADFSAAP